MFTVYTNFYMAVIPKCDRSNILQAWGCAASLFFLWKTNHKTVKISLSFEEYSHSFSPILCCSLFCCVCWLLNSQIWDRIRSLRLSFSVSCEKKEEKNNMCLVIFNSAAKSKAALNWAEILKSHNAFSHCSEQQAATPPIKTRMKDQLLS